MKHSKFSIFLQISIPAIIALCTILYAVILTPKQNNKSIFDEYYNQKCETYRMENAYLSKGQIVFVGDSNTDLYKLDDYYSDLDKAVYNRGIGGDTTSGVLDRLQVSLFDIAPSKIVLLIGNNDINGNRDFDTIVKNYKSILAQIHQNLPTAEVFCISVIPLHEKLNNIVVVDDKNHTASLLNVEIKNLADEFSYTYLDLFHLICDENQRTKDEYTIDGLHLSAKGYEAWASLVKPYLV